MKKFIAILLAVATVVLCSVCVFAARADQAQRDTLLKLIDDYEIKLKDGTVLVFADADVNAAKNFLSSYEGTVDQEKIDGVKEKLDAAAAVVINSTVPVKSLSDIKKLSTSEKQAIITYANEALALFNLVAAFNARTNKVEYTDIDTGALVYESSAVLKKTDNAVSVAPIAVVSVVVALAVIGCALVVKKYALAK